MLACQWFLPFVSVFILASSAIAGPTKLEGCQVSAHALASVIPAEDKATLVAPSTSPNYVAVGVGVQNYTCNSGTFQNIGALAELFDISCLYGSSVFDGIQSDIFAIWKLDAAGTTASVRKALGRTPAFLGDHYFIANPAGSGANVPKFDFTSGRLKGNDDAFVVAAKVGDVAAPNGKSNIDWLMLNATAGRLASQVFRVKTVAGQPPDSCSANETASIKYTAKYFFYGSEL